MRAIAISGKMGSGKSTLLRILQSKNDSYERVSLADPVKDVAHQYFSMNKNVKDRWLLQQIGQSFRTIKPSVWVDLLHKRANDYLNNKKIPVCDDVRFSNELQSMKDKNWILIRLKLPEKKQLARIKRTYGAGWESHWDYRFEESETSLDGINDDAFDFVFENTDLQKLELLADEIINASYES